MKKIKLFLKLFFSIFLGLIITLYIAQYQIKLKTTISKYIKKYMKESLNSNIEFNLAELRVFTPFIKIENVLVKPIDNEEQWFWSCKTITFNCSIIDILFFKTIKPIIIVNNLEAFSYLKNNKIDILPHFKKLLFSGNNPYLPMVIRLLKLKKSSLNIKSEHQKIEFDIRFDSETTDLDKKVLQSRVYLNNGYFSLNNNKYCTNIQAFMNLGIFYNGYINNFSIDGLSDLNFLDPKSSKCFFISKWQIDSNDCLTRFFTIDGQNILKFLFTNLKTHNKKINLSLNSDFGFLEKILKTNTNLIGKYDLDLSIDLNDLNNFTGILKTKNFSLTNSNSISLKDTIINFQNNSDFFYGNINSILFDMDLSGKFNWCHSKNSGNLFLENIKKTNVFLLNLSFNKLFEFNGELNTQYNDLKIKTNFHGNQKEINLNGNLDTQKIDLHCLLKPDFQINKFIITDSNNNQTLNLIAPSSNNLQIMIDCYNIQNYLKDYFNLLSGNGKLEINGNYNKEGFSGKLSLKNGNIILPEIHNIIKEVEGKIEIKIKDKKILLKNLIIRLHQGIIECNLTTINFDLNESKKIQFIHCPLILKDCFFNIHNSLFTKLSGRLLLQKKPNNNFKLNGYISLNKTHIKDNIFSTEFRNEIFKKTNPNEYSLFKDIDFDISIFNIKSIKLKTTFLESLMNLDLKLLKQINSINLLGQINLLNGKILLPYKELKIIEGKIKFTDDLTNPLISLIAKNRIKNHVIKLQISGTAQNPEISLESNPKLSDEQIISLLLIGSKDYSLNLVIPTLLIENIKNIALSSDKNQENLYKNFKVLLKPFKYIKFIPEFNQNNTLTAKLDVDINDRLNATIAKKLNSQEKTKVNIDYTLTDNLSIQAGRDETGNLSTDLEFRYKF